MKLGFLSDPSTMWHLLCSLIRAAQYILHLDMPAKSLSAFLQDGWVVPEGLDTQQEDFDANLPAASLEEGRAEGNESGSAGDKQHKFLMESTSLKP